MKCPSDVAKKIECQKERVLKGKKLKTAFCDTMILINIIIIIILGGLLFWLVHIDLSISYTIPLGAIIITALMVFVNDIFKRATLAPKLRYVEKISINKTELVSEDHDKLIKESKVSEKSEELEKESDTLEKLTEFTNKLIMECYLKHKIIIYDVDFTFKDDFVIMSIAFK